MKGIIVDYFEDKGFGFIKDENEEKRFFHISNINDKHKFLENLSDYYFSDWVERKCYVINFNASQNEKGLNALNIELTDQIFNDESLTAEFEAKIIDFKYDTASLTRTVSGIKQGMSKPFGVTSGGNGTYRLGYPEVLRELNIYFRRIDDIGWGTIDVREISLKINERSKITEKFIHTLRTKIIGKTVKIIPSRKNWSLKDNLILKI